METSRVEDCRSFLAQLSRVAAGSRPDISASLGELRLRVNCLRDMDVFAVNRFVSFLQETAGARTLKFPIAPGPSRLRPDISGDGATGKLRQEKCVDPQSGWPWVLGDGFPGSCFHFLGMGSRQLCRGPVPPLIARF